MWRLQLKKLDAWSRLCALSLGAHLIFLVIVFFVYKGDSYHVNLTFNARDLSNATIIFMPGNLQSSAKQMINKGSVQKGNKKNSVSHDIPAAPKEIKTAQSIAKPEVKSTVAKTTKSESSVTKTSKSTTPPATRLATTAVSKTKPTKKLNKSKKIKATSQNKKREVEKTSPQKTKSATKTEAEKPVVKTEKVFDQKTQEPKATETADDKINNQSSPIAHNDVAAESGDIIYVDQKNLDALQTQHIIQEELSRHFTPPAGLSKELQCELTLTVGFDGVVTRVEIAKSSGAAIFDMSARAAVGKLTLPPWTHGKELTITFNN